MTNPTQPKVVAREITLDKAAQPVYSFCTLVTNVVEYRNMVEAFHDKGFLSFDCKFPYIDNSRENQYDGFSGNNRSLQEARGQYVVLLHQDLMPTKMIARIGRATGKSY